MTPVPPDGPTAQQPTWLAPRRSSEKPPGRGRGPFGWIGANVATALSLAGLVIYGVNRYSYDLFYRQLGTTPEEVGLGYTQILGQSVVGFVVLLAFAFAFAFLYGLFMYMNLRYIRSTAKDTWAELQKAGTSGGSRPRLSLGVLAYLVAAAVVLVVGIVAVDRVAPTWLTNVLAWGGLAVGTVAVLVKGLPSATVSLKAAVPGAVVATLFVAAFSVLYVLEVVTKLRTVGDQEVPRGTVVSLLQDSALAPPLVAQRATIDWTGPPDKQPSDRWSDCVFYLGTANGTSIFFDAGHERGLRIPAAAITIRLRDQDC